MKKYLVFIIIIFVFYLIISVDKTSKFNEPKNLELADIVLRKGIGAQSEVISQVLDSNLTHIAIISNTNPLKIIHATYDDFDANGVVEFSWEKFAKGSKYIKIIRLNLSKNEKDELVKNLKKQLGKDFKISTDEDNLYCTTFIAKELQKYLNKDLKYIYIDNIFIKGKLLPPKSFLDLDHSVIYEEKLQD